VKLPPSPRICARHAALAGVAGSGRDHRARVRMPDLLTIHLDRARSALVRWLNDWQIRVLNTPAGSPPRAPATRYFCWTLRQK